MAKQSAFMQKLAREQRAAVRDARWFTMQQSLDMAMIALNEGFGFGEERLARFVEVYRRVWTEYAEATLKDAQDDSDIEYTRAKIDEKLKDICGDFFQPWDERYK